jgi:hypothetical protein
MLFESVDPCRKLFSISSKEVKTEDVFLVYNHFNRHKSMSVVKYPTNYDI